MEREDISVRDVPASRRKIQLLDDLLMQIPRKGLVSKARLGVKIVREQVRGLIKWVRLWHGADLQRSDLGSLGRF